MVDFNPSSAIISATFIKQLKHQGIENILSIDHLLSPDRFNKEELPHVVDQIAVTSPADKTKLRKWLEIFGGVDLGDGIKQPLGIETEALILDFDRLKNIFKEKFNKIMTNTFDKINNKYFNILDIDIWIAIYTNIGI